MKIFIDMDGVLCDFATEAMALFGQQYDRRKWPIGHYCIASAVGVDVAEMWRRINARGSLFWENLNAYPWAADLLKMVRDYDAEFSVASVPGPCGSSAAGKLRWLDKNTGEPPPFRRYFLGPEKHLLAGPGRVLIDDKTENCEQWVAAGGSAIIWPQPWNRNSGLCDVRIEHTANALDTIAERLEQKASA